jgi:hypothetical protein
MTASRPRLTPSTTTAAPRDFSDYLLAELRCASLRARLLQLDIEAIGVALKGRIIMPEQALALLDDVDALRIVGTPLQDPA